MTPSPAFHTPEKLADSSASSTATFSIRDLCEAFDVTPRALRFYESQGLVSPERVGQKRIYSQRDRARLYLLLRAKRFGFSLAEIRELLDLYDLNDQQETQLKATVTSCQEKLGQLEARREELEEAIDELTAIIGKINGMIAAIEAEGGTTGKTGCRPGAQKKR